MIRILHLTDFHLNEKTLRDWNDFYKDAFFEKLKELQIEREIDLVAFTGDLIDKGGKDFETATLAFNEFKNNIINPILEYLKLDISKFIICAGNHDINRFADTKFDEIGLKQGLKNSEEVIDFIQNSQENSSFKYIERIREYKEFEYKLYESTDIEKKQSLFEFSVKLNIKGKTVGVSSLNSSWRCYDDDDKGNILLGENQLNNNLQFIKNCDIKVALLHHQLDWLSSIESKTITGHIFKDYNILLSGHVHESSSNMTTSVNGTCFQNVSPSGLNQIRTDNINYVNGFTVIDYDDTINCHYLKYNHSQKKFVDNTDYFDGGRSSFNNSLFNSTKEINESKNEITIEEDFLDFLNDIGANFTHRGKDVLFLNDLYISPFLEEFSVSEGEDKISSLNTEKVFEKIKNEEINHVIFLGEESAGKTTTCKILYKYLYTNQFIPVYLKGKDIKQTSIKDVNKLIEREFHRQYNNDINKCERKKVIIIDDFNNSILRPKFKKNFINNLYSLKYQTIIIWDEYFTLSKLLDSGTLGVSIYEIQKFGAKKRFELIKKWTNLFEDEFEDDASKFSYMYGLEKTINSVIGKNLVPSYPIYILTILQANELTTSQNLEQSTFGHYYDVLIKSSLGQKLKENKEIEKYYSYLSELSFWMFNNTTSLKEDEIIKFHTSFQEDYRLNSSFVEAINLLLNTKILIKTYDGEYQFKYKYIYFYFIGRYLSDNIEDKKIQQIVSNLSKRIYQTDSANIYLFLSHHSKSKFIINQIISNAKELFNEEKILNFKEDVAEINKLIGETTENLKFDTSLSFEHYKNEELEDKEKAEITEVENDILEYDFDDDPDGIDSISKINKSFKTIEILGYIIKNRYASLKGNDKEEIVEELYVLGLRTLSFLFKTLIEGEEYIKNEIIDLIKSDSDYNLTKREKEDLAKQFLFNLLYMISYSVFKKISSSISTKDLQITFDDLKEKYKDNNAVSLIDIAIKFDYYKEFPIKDTNELVKIYKNNKLPYYILKRLGINFMKMIPMKEQDQQKAGNILEISMDSQRLLGETSTIKK